MTDVVGDAAAPAASGSVEELADAWAARQVDFAAWVRGVARAYSSSSISLEGAATLLDCSPAELQAVLNLATMDDDDLALLAAEPPPKSTWFLFGAVEGEAVAAGVEALRDISADDSPFIVVNEAIVEASGPDVLERVAALSAETIGTLATKAKQYDALRPKDRHALVSLSRWKKSGKPFTEKQLLYLHGMLTDLVACHAVSRPSPDDDQELCDEVLEALGM